MTRRTKQVGALIQKVIAEIVQKKIKNPFLSDYLISITDVDISKDFSSAKIYISYVPHDDEEEKIIDTLQKSEGFFRKELSNEIRLKKIPKLNFILDKTNFNVAKIEKLIKELPNNSESL
ncbi:MAG: ribosome-binding factor A [Chloroflexi bacterium]|nr:ribosome-binding factor A [Chloroflexota bacterium]|tara:strand:- start:34832 stop:35191 length:360 start_codon:yes stop_codon:yes gene_type:complete